MVFLPPMVFGWSREQSVRKFLLSCPFLVLWLRKTSISLGFFFLYTRWRLHVEGFSSIQRDNLNEKEKENWEKSLPSYSSSPKAPNQSAFFFPVFRVSLCLFQVLCPGFLCVFHGKNRKGCVYIYCTRTGNPKMHL